MYKILIAASTALATLTQHTKAEERVICSVAWEVGEETPLLSDGQCDERMSSASTFKIAISLMGFDSGILTSPDTPEWPFKADYLDWRPEWKQSTTPEAWLKHSVVWYSQQITLKIGSERFEEYVNAFDYGNKDITGVPGVYDGLTYAWLRSTLKISPLEQINFLTKMLAGKLPVTETAVLQTKAIMERREQPNGWITFGKTGSGLPTGEDGQHLQGQPFGWYVGWAEKDDRQVVFARLIRFDSRPEQTPGAVARDGILEMLFTPVDPLIVD
ncbi:class D beta-lactamase [Roseibium porphyridii]|uniref:beta-lactamase n=1 Tax=Roseibium porphyridii TaxID=2866279 RepID=A0ABY8F2W0_9HYPH|nr:class D beta-lactamase [Roseibium sp. KMA01]WFE89801.1 class D beta-lactamase [Roseibium sp. KMA01]